MDINVAKARLAARRVELAHEMGVIEHALDAPLPSDWEDRASERQGDEVLERMGTNDAAALRRVDAALERIAHGTYGVCMECGEPISDARLKAVPEAALCIKCA